MRELFLNMVNISVSAGWLVIAVLLVRLVLRKAPKWTHVLLWGIVALRLLFPFSIESAVSLIPSTETIPTEILADKPEAELYKPATLTIVDHPAVSEPVEISAGTDEQMFRINLTLWSFVWLLGLAAMLLYTAVSYLRLGSQVRTAVLYRGNIYRCEQIEEPFVLGIVRPKIYLPDHLDGTELELVVAHEQAHIKRLDPLWKLLGFLLLAIHWFNPLLWLAYILLCRDIEMACDEKAIQKLEDMQRADYSQVLLNCSTGRRGGILCPLAFGEIGVKTRIKSVLQYKKPAVWIVLLAVTACIVVAVCFLTEPYTAEIRYNDCIYVQKGASVQTLPPGSTEQGNLIGVLHRSGKAPEENLRGTNLDEKYAGCPIYLDPADPDTLYLFDHAGFYIPFVLSDAEVYTQTDADHFYLVIGAEGVTHIEVSMPNSSGGCQNADGSAFELGEEVYLEMLDGVTDLRGTSIVAYDENGSVLHQITIPQNVGDEEVLNLVSGDGWLLVPKGVLDVLNKPADVYVETELPLRWQCSPVGTEDETFGKMLEIGGVPENAILNSVHALPAVRIDSAAEFDVFCKAMEPYMNFENSDHADALPFSETAEQYDESFFETYTLIFMYTEAPNLSIRYAVEYAVAEGESLYIGVEQLEPDWGAEQTEGWLIALWLPADQVVSVEKIDARVTSVVYTDRQFPSGNLIKTYVFEEGNGTTVSLYDSGEFTFTFSLISSYFGLGTYTEDDGRLVLETMDSAFTYVFDRQGDVLVFDAAASSETTWFSGLYDGAILK